MEPKPRKVLYLTRPTPFGRVALAWDAESEARGVMRIALPRPGLEAEAIIRAEWPRALRASSEATDNLADRIAAFLEGEPLEFGLEGIALEERSPFQRRVLAAEHAILRGWVGTYGGIAAHIGRPGAGRAVGRALATNPFPIVIPCHRAIRSDGLIGGYQGGPGMKRILLEREGVVLSSKGVVTRARLRYGALPGRRP
jgi:methylated-DNA-[protein]-cysteine S-methyltransferase